VGREPIMLVQIDQDFCQNTYGVSPCTATDGPPCYNTRKTCQDPENYDLGNITLTFAKSQVSLPKDENLLPFMVSASIAPTKLNPSSGNLNTNALGERGVVTIDFVDGPYSDLLTDPYRGQRGYDPLTKSTFWAKWLARNPYYQNRAMRLYQGYLGDALEDMPVRHYLIDSISGPDSSGRVKLVGKDPLKLAERERAQVPPASTGQLHESIDNSTTTIIANRCFEEDYPAPGVIRIGDELITYTGRTQGTDDGITIVTFSGVTRGTNGTTADNHDEESSVQLCFEYDELDLWEAVYDLLVNYAGIDPAYIDETEWEDEWALYLQQFDVTVLLSEPTSVAQCINELAQQFPFMIWWDERNNKIQFRAVRYYVGEFPVIDEFNIIENTFSVTTDPRNRISQVWVYHYPRNRALSDRKNFDRLEINANLELEGPQFYDESKIRLVEARWLTNNAQAFNLTSRLIRGNFDNPIYVKIRLDAKDSNFWTGDVIDLFHRSIVDFDGDPIGYRYLIVSSQEVVSGETIEYQLQKLITLAVKKGVYMAADAPQYADATPEEKEDGAWYADANGFLPIDVDGYEYE
jgi:hypothetical protein